MTRAAPPGAATAEDLVASVSGVRGRIGAGLTPEVMARLAASHGYALLERASRQGSDSRTVVVGRDSRVSGPMLRDAAVAGLLSVGCDVVDLGLSPTPTSLMAVTTLGALGGLVVSASHNPAAWNAAKLASSRGMFLTPAEGEQTLALFRAGGPPRVAWDAVGAAGRLDGFLERHVERILAAPEVDAGAVRSRAFRVVLDACHGVGALLLSPLLDSLGCIVVELHVEPTGRFPRDPEPLPENLIELGARVRETGADLGMAVDPDGDRLALVDGAGRPIGEDLTLALAVSRVLRFRPGPVVTNLSTSRVVQDAAEAGGAELVRTPVGEIHVAQRMLELGAAIGGEGNGGVIYPAVHHTRDAGSAAALVLSLLAAGDATLAAVAEGRARYAIVKDGLRLGTGVRVPEDARLERLFPGAVADRQDGLRLAWHADRAWLHVRASGTEPIVRIIAEAPTAAAARHLVARARRAFEPLDEPAAALGTG
ncbi:MAG: phosphoglucosamine mutase [Gemmatimonadetes bacterium]|nr:phosphoglucosamine mutase [Gemmatimonadota bacterium]